MLRAVRFAATLGFAIEPATLAAIQQAAAQVNVVSGERIGAELRRMLGNFGCPIAIVSTGPDRDANIVLQDPFA